MIDFVYVLLASGSEWEDIVLFLSKDEAIKVSLQYPNRRVEMFDKEENIGGYVPTYNYYKNGIFCQSIN